jgi:ubiquinone/menaquinone biosynthesis C-methylase UbiE
MICPHCEKPYLFISPKDKQTLVCLKCDFRTSFTPPNYDCYHQNLYTKDSYQRTPETDPQMKKILKTLDIKPDSRVLDIGCGVGDYTHAVHTHYSENIIGIDMNITAAKKKYPNIDFSDHDCNLPLPFPDHSFDFVIAINIIEHLLCFENFLTECSRVLKKNAMIALTTANLNFFLHRYFYDQTHLHEWDLYEFQTKLQPYFQPVITEKSSAMFKYYPFNFFLRHVFKPDLLFIGKKLCNK